MLWLKPMINLNSPFFSNLNWTPGKFISVTCNCLKQSWPALRVTGVFLQDSSQLHFALYNDHWKFWPSQLFSDDTLPDGTRIWWLIYIPGELKQSLPPVIFISLQKQGWLTAWKLVPELADCNSMHSWKPTATLFGTSSCIRLQAVKVQELFANQLGSPNNSCDKGWVKHLRWDALQCYLPSGMLLPRKLEIVLPS